MITQQDLITEFGEDDIIGLSDHDHTGKINAKVVAKAIKRAEGEAQSYLNGASITRAMLIPAPEILKANVCDIAKFRLAEDGATEEEDKRYKLAIAWLKEVRANPKMLNAEFNQSDDANGINSSVDVVPNPKPNWDF